jgi:hypothetical protein
LRPNRRRLPQAALDLLIALGWRLFEQDRSVALQQLQDRRRQTADLVVTALEQALTGTEQTLRNPAALDRLTIDGDAVVIVTDASGPGVAKGERRELAVARLQSDFVAAGCGLISTSIVPPGRSPASAMR